MDFKNKTDRNLEGDGAESAEKSDQTSEASISIETETSRSEIVNRAFSMSKQEMLELFEEGNTPYYYDDENRLRRRMLHSELEEFGLTPRLISLKVDPTPELVEFIKNWLNQWVKTKKPKESFYISGPLDQAEGLFSLILRGVANRCGIFHAVSSIEFGDQCREHKREDFYSTVGCLGIYNFGMQYRDKDGYWDHFFTNVLTRRYDHNLPTVIVGQYSKDQILQMYGAGTPVGPAFYARASFIETFSRATQEIVMGES